MQARECRAEKQGETCTNQSSHYAQVSLPLTLRPYARAEAPQVDCCGEPIVTLRENRGGVCELCITQTLCIRLSVCYGAQADCGEAAVHCAKPPVYGGPCCK